MTAFVIGMFEENGHPGDDESENQQAHGDHEKRYADLRPARRVSQVSGQLPVESDYRDIKPIQHYPQHGDDRRDADELHVFLADSDCKHETRQQHEA